MALITVELLTLIIRTSMKKLTADWLTHHSSACCSLPNTPKLL
jgi:hypothetical protein